MILIALGANLPTERFGSPRQTLEAALNMMETAGIKVVKRSSWYESEPVPPSGQPWYINGVAQVETTLRPAELLRELHRIEEKMGRIRRKRWESRVIDLDLLAYGHHVAQPDGNSPGAPHVPHPRMAERLFVLRPLAEIDPDWRHPLTGQGVGEMLNGLHGQGAVNKLNE